MSAKVVIYAVGGRLKEHEHYVTRDACKDGYAVPQQLSAERAAETAGQRPEYRAPLHAVHVRTRRGAKGQQG